MDYDYSKLLGQKYMILENCLFRIRHKDTIKLTQYQIIAMFLNDIVPEGADYPCYDDYFDSLLERGISEQGDIVYTFSKEEFERFYSKIQSGRLTDAKNAQVFEYLKSVSLEPATVTHHQRF